MATDCIRLADLIRLDELQKMQDSFALTTGVGACIHEVDGTPITKPSNWCELCLNYHRKSEVGSKRCLESNARLGAKVLELGQPVIDYCSSGHLLDAAVPIRIDGQCIGIVTCGQVLYRSPNLDEYRNIAREIGVDEEGYLEALRKVTIMPKERFQAAVFHLYQVAHTLSALGYQRLNEKRLKHKLACTLKDVRRMVRELEKGKIFNQAVVASMADMLVAIDNDGKWVSVNPAFERITGYSAEEVLGKETPEQPLITPRALEKYQKMWQEVFTGETVTNVRAPWIRKDNQEIIISGAEQLLKDAKGNIMGRIWTARDVTEARRKEKATKELKSFLDYTRASLSDMFFTLDKNGVVTEAARLVNAERASLSEIDSNGSIVCRATYNRSSEMVGQSRERRKKA